LFLVLFISLVLFIVIIGLLHVLGTNLRQVEAYDERTKAYYLCETAASVGLLDMRNGKIGHESGQWTERTVNLVLDGKTYPVKYTFTRSANGRATITMDTSSGFQRIYHLRVGGRRAVPIFIRGFGGR